MALEDTIDAEMTIDGAHHQMCQPAQDRCKIGMDRHHLVHLGGMEVEEITGDSKGIWALQTSNLRILGRGR